MYIDTPLHGLNFSRDLIVRNLYPERCHGLIVFIYLHVVTFVLYRRNLDVGSRKGLRIYLGFPLAMEVVGFHSEGGVEILRPPCVDCGRCTFGWCDGTGQTCLAISRLGLGLWLADRATPLQFLWLQVQELQHLTWLGVASTSATL